MFLSMLSCQRSGIVSIYLLLTWITLVLSGAYAQAKSNVLEYNTRQFDLLSFKQVQPQAEEASSVIAHVHLKAPSYTLQKTYVERALIKREKLVKEDFADIKAEQKKDKSETDYLLRIGFEFSDANVGSALFNYAGWSWIAFDKPVDFDAAYLANDVLPQITELKQIFIENGTLIKFKSDYNNSMRLTQNNNVWNLDVLEYQVPLSNRVETQRIHENFKNNEIQFFVEKPSSSLRYVDPLSGLTLLIGTFQNSKTGYPGKGTYVNFDILETSQGLAIVSYTGEHNLDKDAAGYMLSYPGGLLITPSSAKSLDYSASLKYRQLFKWNNWYGDLNVSFSTKHRRHMAQIASLPARQRNEGRLNLARFLAAYGHGVEAITVLNVMLAEQPVLKQLAEIQALIGAAYYLSGKYTQSIERFKSEGLEDLLEAKLWQGASLYHLGQYELAEDLFQESGNILLKYPRDLRDKFTFPIIHTALHNNNVSNAQGWLQEMAAIDNTELTATQKANTEYLTALVQYQLGTHEEALNTWEKFITTRNYRLAALSRYQILVHQYNTEQIALKEAIKELSDLLYVWRGSSLEVDIIILLSDLYFKDQQYRYGLRVLRNGAEATKSNLAKKQMQAKMLEYFKELFLENKGRNLNTLDVLVMFDEFRDLIPINEEGNAMLRRIVVSLISVDLMDQALVLLRYQLAYRADGVERAWIGMQIALIQLIENKPLAAIDIINQTNHPAISSNLSNDRRRLKIQALILLARYEEASELLTGDISRDADFLRRDLYWRQANWFAVSEVLYRLAGSPPQNLEDQLDDVELRSVFNLAVALKLDSDTENLQILRERYLHFMNKTYLANAFDTLTSGVNNDINAIISTGNDVLIGGAGFNDFVQSYRSQLSVRRSENDFYPNKKLDSTQLDSLQAQDTNVLSY